MIGRLATPAAMEAAPSLEAANPPSRARAGYSPDGTAREEDAGSEIRMKRKRLALTLIGVILSGAVIVLMVTSSLRGPLTAFEASTKLERMLRDAVDDDDSVRNAVLLIAAPRLGIEGAWAAGVADEQLGVPMTVDTPFLSASIGKLFTAATVLALAEEGLFSLSDPITEHLEPSVLDGLPIAGGDAALARVTIRHLLCHRSGFPDYFEAETDDGSANVMELLIREPDRTWTPTALLDYTRTHFAPIGAPDETFHYADTNYDLLGLIVEAATGRAFHEAVVERVLRPLGLDTTWYYQKDAGTDGESRYADVFASDRNLARKPALSLDWAGGGLATTVRDLERAMLGFQSGRVVPFERFQETWSRDAITRGIDYAYGLWRIRPPGLFFLLDQPTVLGVSGATGSFVYWVPEYDAVICGTFDQLDWADDHVVFLVKVLSILDRVETS
jgi:D-alanyl-D-alanine carboxypeptidase